MSMSDPQWSSYESQEQVKRLARLTPEEEVAAVAKSRTWRSFKNGLWAFMAVAIGPAIAALFTNVQWTWQYWVTGGLMLATVILAALGAYIRRWLEGDQKDPDSEAIAKARANKLATVAKKVQEDK